MTTTQRNQQIEPSDLTLKAIRQVLLEEELHPSPNKNVIALCNAWLRQHKSKLH